MIKQVFKKKHHTHKTKTIVRRKKQMGKCILRKKHVLNIHTIHNCIGKNGTNYHIII
jgi:hypothetical protein